MAVAWKHRLAVLAGMAVSAGANAQVPDLLTAFDAGGRAMGAGSSMGVTGVDTLSIANNPAGLGYASQRSVGFAARNFPSSTTRVTGQLNDLRLSTSTDSGKMGLGHFGYAMPWMRGGKQDGALGIAFTVGGYFNDRQSGTGLLDGSTQVSSYRDFTRVKTDFVTIAYGRAVGDQSLSIGLGLVYARQNVRQLQSVTFAGDSIPARTSDADGTGSGIGATAGLMYTPPNRPNLTLGLSVQTPISISGDSPALDLYNRIPGRVSAGLALRQDGLRGGKDFMIYGAQADWFFGGKGSGRLDRSDQMAVGFGVEYNRAWGAAILPIRVGYRFVEAGGDEFDSRNGLTYGVGYRPTGKDWSVELNFARPQGGGQDMSLFFTYRFGK